MAPAVLAALAHASLACPLQARPRACSGQANDRWVHFYARFTLKNPSLCLRRPRLCYYNRNSNMRNVFADYKIRLVLRLVFFVFTFVYLKQYISHLALRRLYFLRRSCIYFIAHTELHFYSSWYYDVNS